MSFDRRGFYREIGLRLQLARKREDLTQQDLAAVLEMPRSSYANIERGRQRAPADVLWRAALVLGVDVDTLMPEAIRSRPLSEHTPRATTSANELLVSGSE